MPTAKEQADEVIRKLTETNLVAEFASSILHCDHTQTDVFVKACGDRFEFDGVQLMFKGASGKVPATNEHCTGFFQHEYAFLMPVKSEQQGTFDPELVAKAKGGNLTAKGQLFKLMHGDKKGGEAETQKRLDKLLAENSNSGEDDTTNPFRAGNWNVTEQAKIVRRDPALAARLAKTAGVAIGSTRPKVA